MLTLTMIKCYTYTATYAKGREIFAKGGVQVWSSRKPGKNGVRLTADVKGSGKKWYRTMVELGQDDDIEDYTCSCPAYSSFYGMCKHCVALALHYRDNPDRRPDPGEKARAAERQTSDALKQILSQYGIRENGPAFGGILSQCTHRTGVYHGVWQAVCGISRRREKTVYSEKYL